MNSHYGFLHCNANNVMYSVQLTFFISSTSSGSAKDQIKGQGTYMYKDNFRRSISLFSTRRLSTDNFISHEDVYIGRVENE